MREAWRSTTWPAASIPSASILYRQSDLPETCELAWILTTVTPMGLLERAHAYKDKTRAGAAPDHGLFAYPVLMAADILLFNSDLVPVGQDQKQHLEMARDIARSFNHAYGGRCSSCPSRTSSRTWRSCPASTGAR